MLQRFVQLKGRDCASEKRKMKSSSNDKRFEKNYSFSQRGKFVRGHESISGDSEEQFSKNKLSFKISETGSVHLRTVPHRHAIMARTALQCMSADMAYGKQYGNTSANCFVQVVEAYFPKTGPAHLYTPRHCQIPIYSSYFSAENHFDLAF